MPAASADSLTIWLSSRPSFISTWSHWRGVRCGRGPATKSLCQAGEEGSRLADLFAGTGIKIRLEPDFRSAAWRKLLHNVAHNPILALTGRRADLFEEPEVLALAAELISEAVAVAAAEGIEVGESSVPGIVSALGALPADAGNSMLFDRLRGRALESEFITGAVVEAGRRAGVPTPLNEVMLTLLRAAGGAKEED